MSNKRKVSLRLQLKRELSLWSIFALDSRSSFASAPLPLPLRYNAKRYGQFEALRAHFTDQVDLWRQDFGLARLVFSQLKKHPRLAELWNGDALWSELTADIERFLDNQAVIDALITQSSLHWKLGRMGGVDRAILRLGTYELCFHNQTAATQILNQAVELGKRYGSSESGRFINGVLDRIAQDLGRVQVRSPSPQVDIQVSRVSRRS